MSYTNSHFITFSFKTYWHLLHQGRRALVAWLAVFGVIGIVVAFTTPKFYKSGSLLAPESSGGNALSGLSSLASLVGVNKSMMGGDDAIGPDLYPDVMSSTDFVLGMLGVQVETRDGSVCCDYNTYLRKHQKFSLFDYPMMAVGWAKRKLLPEDDNIVAISGKAGRPAPRVLSKKQYSIVKYVAETVTCTVDEESMMVYVEATDQDPLVATELVDSAIAHLTKFVQDYRKEKALQELGYIEGLVEEARADYEKARGEYAAYCDVHQNMLFEREKSQQEALQNEVMIQQNNYTRTIEQVQAAKAKLHEDAPVFTVVQRAYVPVKHSNSPKVVVLAFYLLLGFFFFNVRLVCRHWRALFIPENLVR